MFSPLPFRIDRHHYHNSLLALFLVATITLPPQAASAQEATADKVADDEQEGPAAIETFQLRHADAPTVLNVLKMLLAEEDSSGDQVRIAIGRDDRVIVRGTQETLQKVRETIRALDQAHRDPSTVKVLSLKYADAAQAGKLISQLVDDARVVFDLRTNSLVVSSTSEETLDKIEALGEVLDRPTRDERVAASYHLELFWLLEGGDSDEIDTDDITKPIDARIVDVAKRLEQQGFAEPKQVGHLSVLVRSGGEFHLRSNETLGQLTVLGELEESGDEQLELKIELEITYAEEEIASMMTEFTTRLKRQEVIGIATDRVPKHRSAFVILVEK